MKKLTVIALALLSTGAALAQGLSREQVVADLVRARASGELAALQSENISTAGLSGSQAGAGSALSRAAVTAEFQRARAAGELPRTDGEAYGARVDTGSAKTRAQVLAELRQARASGELDLLNSNNPSYAQLVPLNRAQPARELLAGQAAKAQ